MIVPNPRAKQEEEPELLKFHDADVKAYVDLFREVVGSISVRVFVNGTMKMKGGCLYILVENNFAKDIYFRTEAEKLVERLSETSDYGGVVCHSEDIAEELLPVFKYNGDKKAYSFFSQGVNKTNRYIAKRLKDARRAEPRLLSTRILNKYDGGMTTQRYKRDWAQLVSQAFVPEQAYTGLEGSPIE